MILDTQALLSDAQAVTADAVSTNTYDSGAAGNDVSIGEELCIMVTVDTAADFTTGDETYAFQVIQSANANLSSPDVLSVRTVLAADLTAGAKIHLPIPMGSKSKRYLGLNYDVGGTSPSVTVTAAIVPSKFADVYKAYADGITIS